MDGGNEDEYEEDSSNLPFGDLDLDEHESHAVEAHTRERQRQQATTSTVDSDRYVSTATASLCEPFTPSFHRFTDAKQNEEIAYIHAMANKMDAMMSVMFTYLDELRKVRPSERVCSICRRQC